MTVAIPCYNGAPTVGEAVASACGQDGDFSLEVLVSDNASEDGTWDVLTEFAADPRLKAVRQEKNLGMEGNFQFCLGEARGEWILFLGADDWLLPGAISALLTHAGDFPHPAAVFGSWRWDGGRSGEILQSREGVSDGRRLAIDSMKMGRNFAHLSATLLRTESARAAGLASITFFDWLLFLRLAWSRPVCETIRVVAAVRAHAHNETCARYGERPAGHCKSLGAVLTRFQELEGEGDAMVATAVREGRDHLASRYADRIIAGHRHAGVSRWRLTGETLRLLALPMSTATRLRLAGKIMARTLAAGAAP